MSCPTGGSLTHPIKERVFFEVFAAVEGHLHLYLQNAALCQGCEVTLVTDPRNEVWAVNNHLPAFDLTVQNDLAKLALNCFVGLQPAVV